MGIYEIRDGCRANLNTYLRQALNHLPKMDGTRLLDAGCGTGVSSCEIARITDWRITSMDIDGISLDVLRRKIARLDIADRITVVQCGMEDAQFAKNSFDIILAEGLFNAIGFECGLSLCGAYLKDGGCMIVHDEMQGREEKLRLFEQSGFDVLAEIALDEAIWEEKYCACLQGQIASVTKNMLKTENDKKLLAEIEREIALFKASPSAFRSIYYVVKKLD